MTYVPDPRFKGVVCADCKRNDIPLRRITHDYLCVMCVVDELLALVTNDFTPAIWVMPEDAASE